MRLTFCGMTKAEASEQVAQNRAGARSSVLVGTAEILRKSGAMACRVETSS